MPDPIVEKQADPSQSGDQPNNSLDSLTKNVADALQTDATVGDPKDTTQPAGDPPAAPGAQVEDKTAVATTDRFRHENAQLRAVLTKLGVDADSDTAENLRNGLITAEEFVKARYTPTTQAQAEPVVPQVPLDQKIRNVQEMRDDLVKNNGDVSAAQFREFANLQTDVLIDLAKANQNITQTQEIRDQQEELSRKISATETVFASEVKSTIPDDVKDIASQMFLGAVDLQTGINAQQVGPRAMTPEGYGIAARNIAPQFDEFVTKIFNAGIEHQKEAVRNPVAPVTPLAPGHRGGTPPPAPKGKFNLRDLDANVHEELKGTSVHI